MVGDVLIAVGDHCSSAVPALIADDVDFFGQKRIGRSNNGPDVEIMLPILDRNMKAMPF